MKIKCPICGSGETKQKLVGIDHSLSKKKFSIHDCGNCMVCFTFPEISTKNLSKYYSKEKYQSYKASFDSLFDIIYGFIRFINSTNKYYVLKGLINGDVLDYGSGSGFFAKFLRNKNLTVYEYEPININKSKWLLTKESLSKKKKVFSVITLWHVLEHINNPEKELTFIKKLLKKNSHIVVAMPNKDSYDNTYYGKYWAGYDLPRHRYHFNRRSFMFLCNRVGLKVKKIFPMYYDGYFVSILSEKNKKSIFSFIKGLYIGFVSNLKANKSKNYSSLIYVLENE
tara:strand:- start:1121 stop:1969 length:849 start_codon:yes stop_codon:yes gene_type:complete